MAQELKYLLILTKEKIEENAIFTAWLNELETAGIYSFSETAESVTVAWMNDHNLNFCNCVILTNDRKSALLWSKTGFICIGIDPALEGFFDGAEAVVMDWMDLDALYIEETFLRALGKTVTIAETERLKIREITETDILKLYEISQQKQMKYAFPDKEMADCFEPERMRAYIANVYRFYGYGLWVVENKNGEIIGCCGISDVDLNEISDDCVICACSEAVFDAEAVLELQYMVAEQFQKQGYGTEMCTAVLEYVEKRLPEYKVCVRIRKENEASIKLIQKIGFHIVKSPA